MPATERLLRQEIGQLNTNTEVLVKALNRIIFMAEISSDNDIVDEARNAIAFIQGETAGRAGIANQDSNPYDEGTKQYDLWCEGYGTHYVLPNVVSPSQLMLVEA